MFNICKRKKVHEENMREPAHWVNGIIGDAYYYVEKSHTLVASIKNFAKEESKLIDEGWSISGEPIALNDQGEAAILQRFKKSETEWHMKIVVHSYTKDKLKEYVELWKQFGYIESGGIESKGICFLQEMIKNLLTDRSTTCSINFG